MWTTWWVWIVAGLALAGLEVAIPGYIFLGFATGAVATGILLGIGLLPASPALLALAFALLSLAAWLALRRTMGLRKGQVKVWDRDINDL